MRLIVEDLPVDGVYPRGCAVKCGITFLYDAHYQNVSVAMVC
jgi:hypothetical protein